MNIENPPAPKLARSCTPLILAAMVLSWPREVAALDEAAPAADRFAFSELLAGDYATGDWLGARDTLEERGIEFFAAYTAEIWGKPGRGRTARRGLHRASGIWRDA
jgi:carbohydrate-selective porin OprB